MSTSDITPTVVLVHGAFVDASSWNGVIAELKAAGLDVVAPPNLLRGVGVDAAYLTGFVEALGRRVVLVAHSYAGAVISQTGSDASNVAGLVYVAAYAPEAGETLGAINARYPDVPLSAALRTFTYTDDRGEQATDTYVDAALFHDAVCAEAPADVADTLARTQRPASLAAFATAVTGTPAWQTAAVLGRRGHRRSRHPPASRARHGQAGGQRDHRDQRLARGPGHASRRRGRSHRPRGQGHQMSAPAAGPFGPVQRIAAGVLDVGYVDIGPPGGRAVLLLHGWPYDIHSYADVAPALAAAGYRVIVPYLRGYGVTRFRSDDAARNGQQAVLAVDAIALMDALGVGQAIVAGFDWGARTANVMAALWPERCRAMVSVSGYLIGSQAAGQAPLLPEAERAWWYQYYFATERGRAGYEAHRHDFARLIWRDASPAWRFDGATFERSAAAFDNPDHVAVVIHNYRWRLGLAAGEPQFDVLEQQLAAFPAISVPTITLEGDANGAPHPDPAAYAARFTGKYVHRTLTGGVGHNLPQEAPLDFVHAIEEVDSFA